MTGELVCVAVGSAWAGALVGLSTGVLLCGYRRLQDRRAHRECGLACPCAAGSGERALRRTQAEIPKAPTRPSPTRGVW